MTPEEVQSAWQVLGTISGAIQWWIGDFLNYTESILGEAYTQYIPEQFDPKTINNWKWVSNRIPQTLRKETLSFTHHLLVSGMNVSEQKKYLNQAEKDKLSTRSMKQMIKADHAKNQPEVIVEQLGPLECPKCGYVFPDEE